MTYLSELQEEEQNKEKIYSSFEAKIKDVEKVRKDTTNYYKSQRYDDKVRFTASVPMHEAIKTEEVIKKQYDNLYDKPYFAHIRLRIKDEHTEDTMECYLSDNESLEFVIPLDNNPNIVLIPFKQEKERPFLAAAFHYYQLKGDEEISLSVVDQHLDKRFTQTLRPELIRDIDLFKRKINSIATFLPRDSGEIEADELLAKGSKKTEVMLNCEISLRLFRCSNLILFEPMLAKALLCKAVQDQVKHSVLFTDCFFYATYYKMQVGIKYY